MKRLWSAVLLLSLCLSLCACGLGGPAVPEGRYSFDSLEADGSSYSADLLRLMGMEGEMYIEFNPDGTGTLNVMENWLEFTWEGNVMRAENDEITFTLEKDTLTFGMDETYFTFKK